ncbi:MAG: hypothetical protein H6981_04450 [Gammaproteobacteria bacterium]|nr:hypothetical protein [Gammaproteobacteria bacterium]
MCYIQHDDDGAVLGLYLDESGTQRIPVDHETWHAIATDADGLTAWRVVDGAAVRVGPPPLTLADQVARARADVRDIAQAVADALIGAYPDYERETWGDQSAEADVYLAWYGAAGQTNDAPDTPVLVAIANARGLTVHEISLRVQANRIAYRAAGAALVAARQAAEDLLDAVTDAAEIAPIVQSVRDLAATFQET